MGAERETLRGASEERLREALVCGVRHLTAGEGDFPGPWDSASAELGDDVIKAVFAEIRSQAVVDFIADIGDIRKITGETELSIKALAIERHDVPLDAFGYEGGGPDVLQAAAWRASQVKR